MSAYKHVMMLLGLALILSPFNSPLHAQDAATQVKLLREQYDQVQLHEKNPLLNNLLVQRDRLITENPDDPEQIFWRLAQLEDALIKGARFNGLEYRVRYGLPDKTEIVQLEKMLRIALEQTDAIDEALASQLAIASDGGLLQDRLIALRDSRLPYLKGMAIVIAVDQGLLLQSSNVLQEAIRQLSSSAMRLRESDRVNASRYLAEALAQEQNIEVAKELLEREVRTMSEMNHDRLGLILSQYEIEAMESSAEAAGRGQLQAAMAGTVFNRLLLIEQSAKHWMDASREALADEEDPERLARHAELERSAFESFLLLQPEQGGAMVPENQSMVDRIIEQRYGRLDVNDYRAAHVPVSVVLGQMMPMLDDPEQLPTAHEMLVSIVDQRGLSPRVQARLLALTMRAEALMGNHAQATDHAIRWSKIATDREEAHVAVGMAASISTAALELAPTDNRLSSVKEKAISHLLENFNDHPDIDRWRFEAGRIAEQGGERRKAFELFDSIDQESPFRARAISRQGILMVQELMTSPVMLEKLDEVRAQIREYLIENRMQTVKFPNEVKPARVQLNLAAAQIELLDSKPTKALEYLSRIQIDSLESAQAERVYELKLASAVATNRVGAVQAVIREIPDAMKQEMLTDLLIQRMLEPGPSLPTDPLIDSSDRKMVLCLTDELVQCSPSSEYQQALIMEGYRRVVEPGKAMEWSQRLLETNPDLGTAMFSRAESLLMIPGSDRAEAIRLYTRLTKMDPADEHNLYWTSQLRLLQLMLEDGRGMDAIEARLNRLQRQYPDLGGTPYIGEFAIVRSGLKSPIMP